MPRSTPPPIATPDAAHLDAFRQRLPQWFKGVARDLPWRRTDDPYRIWLSEIMLQQTRVDQAMPYYERFLDAFPTVETLANAELDEVLLKWEGLGYYSRARNLHKAAQSVVNEHSGAFPASYDGLRSLPGIGPYTGAAVASLAFGLPHAVLDGNVIRVLTRVFAISDDAKASSTRKRLQTLVDSLLPHDQPGPFNEGIMELGAMVGTPRQPKCTACPLQSVCAAFAEHQPEAYPVSKKKAPTPHYDIAVGLLFNAAGEVLIQRRKEEGLLGGLWEFPGGKHEEGESLAETCTRELQEELGVEVLTGDLFARVKHAYSHFKITLHAFRCQLISGTPVSRLGIPIKWVALDDLYDYAFPRANRRIIEQLTASNQVPSLFDGV